MSVHLTTADLAAHPDLAARLAQLAGEDPPEATPQRNVPRNVPTTAALPSAANSGPRRDVTPWTASTIVEAIETRAQAVLERQFTLATMAAVVLCAMGVLLGLLWSTPTMAPVDFPGWTLRASLPGAVGTFLATHLPKWVAVLVALAGGGAVARWGGRWLLGAARVAVMVGAVAVAWAVVRG